VGARCYRIRDKHGRIRPLVLNPQRAVGDVGARAAPHATARPPLRAEGAPGRRVHRSAGARAAPDLVEPNFDALTLAHTKDDTDKLFAITTRAIEHFPPKLLADARRRADARDQFPGSTRSSSPGPPAPSARAAA
jgi:hypothetical protein